MRMSVCVCVCDGPPPAGTFYYSPKTEAPLVHAQSHNRTIALSSHLELLVGNWLLGAPISSRPGCLVTAGGGPALRKPGWKGQRRSRQLFYHIAQLCGRRPAGDGVDGFCCCVCVLVSNDIVKALGTREFSIDDLRP